jgi:pimeloyl-ACP methyl ester carboxylesterase
MIGLATPAGGAASPAGASTGPALDWASCRDRFECARLDVPVAYPTPEGEQVSIALIRTRARIPARRVGTLVVNFGGPGDAGTETLPRALSQIPGPIRDRFDIVSFDPRGTGASRGIDCVDDATTDVRLAEDPTPDDPAELQRFYTGENSTVDVEGACIARYGSWLAAVGTRNVARDLDRIRAALGERRLNFLGFSYGTVLGAVYAQEFPDRVRAMVLDGAVNLSASPEQEQEANAQGFERALGKFLDWCAAAPACAFRSGGDPRTELSRLRDRFEAGLTLPAADGRRVGAAPFYLAMIASLYDRATGWPALGAALRSAATGDGTVLQLLADHYLGRDPAGRYSTLHEAIGPIRCADSPRPTVSFAEFRSTFEDYRQRFPFFGPLVASSPIGCDARLPTPSPRDVLGDVTAAPNAAVLVIGTTGDPATPYSGALDLSRRIAGSRVLTYDSTEHSAYGRGVRCIDDAVNRYLISRQLPPAGRRCRG